MTGVDTASRYLRFASGEAHGQSATYEAWAQGVAGDRGVLDLIDGLPEDRRQPNLVFGAARFTGVEVGPFDDFRTQLIARWAEVRDVALARRTQTNEAGRSAVLLPILAALPQPLALIEVGASAGLCLYPDRFSYQYGDRPRIDPVDRPGPVLHCGITGPVPLPSALPDIAWRAGVDVNPLDVSDAETVRWLETLIWPEQQNRRVQLAAAVAIARAEPPLLVRGDVNEVLDEVLAAAPAGATPVVFHSAVMAYLDRTARELFASKVQRSGAHWISNEAAGVMPMVEGTLPPSPDPRRALFVVASEGRAVAYADGHGQTLHWFS